MSGEITIHVVGNLTDNPQRRNANNGRTCVNFTIASSSRYYDRQTGQYKEGNTVYMRCTAWGDLADHILGTCVKGTRVVAVGDLRQYSYQDDTGKNHNAMDLTVNDLGASLRYATAQINRIPANNNGMNNNPMPNQNGMNPNQNRGAVGNFTDPWSNPSQPGGFANFNDPYSPDSQYQRNNGYQQPQPQQPQMQQGGEQEPEF